MAQLNIEIKEGIFAKIAEGDMTIPANYSVTLDPISESYSTMGKLTRYELQVKNIVGVTNPQILHNGKNSRFCAGGSGTCDIELKVEDDAGYSATDTITVTIS